MPDLESPDKDVDLIIKIADLFEAPALQIQPIGNFLGTLSQTNEFAEEFKQRFPNLSIFARKRLQQRMDNDELSTVDEKPLPFKKVLEMAGPSDKQTFIDSLEVTFEYRPR